ncbi:MAG: serine/threonine-protein kinase [Pseudomonadota bacterium]
MTWVPTTWRDGDASSVSKMARGLAPALTNVGKYHVLSELGRGGMANVYLAVTRGPSGVSKLVVLKALLPDLATEASALTAFLDEARLAAQLNHGNVVQTYEVGTQGERHVIVMEYLEGQSLGNVIRRSAAAGSPLSLAFQLRIIISVLEGLQYAHELSAYGGLPLLLVHRDVSPQNVFVTYDGQVKVLDFGIAKAASSTIHTATGMIKGKISYMSPEQMVGESVDRRADVYSVGCMLWAAATGMKLWKDTPDVQVMRAVMSAELPSPQTVNPECDAELSHIVMKALAFDCNERYQSALQLQEELERYCEQHSIQNRPRDLGRYVSTLFADTRAALRARVEQQLSLVDLVDAPAPAADYVDPSLTTLVELASDAHVVATGTSTALSSSTRNPGTAPAARRTPATALLVGLGLTLILAALFLWRLGPGARGAVAASPPLAVPAAQVIASPKPDNATVELRSLPGNAQLFLDGEPLSGNPSTHILPNDGKIHVLRAESAGYHPATAEFTVPKDDGVELRLEKLEKTAPAPPAPTAARRMAVGARPKLAPPAPNCAQPFFIDKDGIKKLRPACL